MSEVPLYAPESSRTFWGVLEEPFKNVMELSRSSGARNLCEPRPTTCPVLFSKLGAHAALGLFRTGVPRS